MTDPAGAITFTRGYDPYGVVTYTTGASQTEFGFTGEQYGDSTQLLYLRARHYRPTTGRFLTRGVNPNSPNPYLPFDPTGALFLPLALISLVYGKKKKKSKLDVIIIVALFSLSAGMGVAACTGSSTSTLPESSTITAAVTPVSSSTAAVAATVNSTPVPTFTATVPPNTSVEEMLDDLCTDTPTPIPTTDADYKRIIEERFGIIVSDDTGRWATAHIQIVYNALSNIDIAVGGLPNACFMRRSDFSRSQMVTVV